VDQSSHIEPATAPQRLSPRAADALAVAIVFAAYSLTLGVANDLTLVHALIGGAANTVPVVLFGAVARRVIAERVVGRSPLVQAAWHLGLAAAFAGLAYWLLVVLLGLANGVSATEFDVRPFPNRAMAWQLLLNVATYGVVACLAYLQARPAAVTVILSGGGAAGGDGGEGGEPKRGGLSRYFIRSGDEIQPIDVDTIVSITGADDYAEVATPSGRHLVRMTLAEFEKALDPARFIRVHRSRIVNVERIARAEPAGGGRLLLHMEDGEAIAASRAGSRVLRDRVI